MDGNSLNENEIPEIFASNFSLNLSNFIECSRNYENWHILENEDISLSSFFQPPKIIDFDIKNKKNANQISENLSKDTSNITKPLLPKKRINKETKKEERDEFDKNNLDNLLRRIKKLAFNSILKYDNRVISELYNNRLGHGINIKKLLKNNHFQIKCTGTVFNLELLKKTQGEILSEDITTKFTNFPHDHNKTLINNLLNEVDKTKRERFRNLFNKTLSECIDHLIGTKKSKDLEGLENIFDSEIKKINKNKEYIEKLKNIFNDYKRIYNEKIPRKKKTKKNSSM